MFARASRVCDHSAEADPSFEVESQAGGAEAIPPVESIGARLGWPGNDLDHFIHPGVERGYGECLLHVG